MGEVKDQPRKREYLPPLQHTTIGTLLSQGQDAIKMIASSHGHSMIAGTSGTVEENSAQAASIRASVAAKEIRSKMPRELTRIRRGGRYWHTSRHVKVTVVECSVDKTAMGLVRHLVVDEDGNEFKAVEANLE